ncbi:MAG: hypothetical protein CMJ49_01490 [Planctomycetaceae bacterium]|nr:hypothetical protein [Planctomycetaceae bacterium]
MPHYDYGFEDLTYHDVGTLGMAPASPIELTFLGQGRGDSIVTVTASSSPSDPSATGVTINDTLNWPDSEVQQFAGDWTLRFTTDSDRAFADSYDVWFDFTGVEPTYFAFDVMVFQETGGPTAMATVTAQLGGFSHSNDFGYPTIAPAAGIHEVAGGRWDSFDLHGSQQVQQVQVHVDSFLDAQQPWFTNGDDWYIDNLRIGWFPAFYQVDKIDVDIELSPGPVTNVGSDFYARRAGDTDTLTELIDVTLASDFTSPGERSIGDATMLSGTGIFSLVGDSSWDFALSGQTSKTISHQFTTPGVPGKYSDKIVFDSVMDTPNDGTFYMRGQRHVEVRVASPILQVTIPAGGGPGANSGSALGGLAPGKGDVHAAATPLTEGVVFDIAHVYTGGNEALLTLDLTNLAQVFDPNIGPIAAELVSLDLGGLFATGTVDVVSGLSQTLDMGDAGQVSFLLNGTPDLWDGTFGFHTDEWGPVGSAATHYLFQVSGPQLTMHITRPIPAPTSLLIGAGAVFALAGRRRDRRWA